MIAARNTARPSSRCDVLSIIVIFILLVVFLPIGYTDSFPSQLVEDVGGWQQRSRDHGRSPVWHTYGVVKYFVVSVTLCPSKKEKAALQVRNRGERIRILGTTLNAYVFARLSLLPPGKTSSDNTCDSHDNDQDAV